MSKFNKPTKTQTVSNLAGGQAYALSLELELASLVATSLLKDAPYRSGGDTLERLQALCAKIPDKKFLAQAALYGREQMYVRSVSHAVAVEIARSVSNVSWKRPFFNRIVQRPDDAMEITALYTSRYGKPIPNAMKRGIAEALRRFDAYQLAKYNGEGEFSLIDLVNLYHPVPTDGIDLLMNGKLKPADTWEVNLSAAGNDKEKKRDVWVRLVREGKLGYLATLRNLRNILEQAPEALDQALELLVDEQAVAHSKVLPLRFMSAYKATSESGANSSTLSKIWRALDQALVLSLRSVPKFAGRTAILLDVSGSMSCEPMEKAAPFAISLMRANDCDLYLFNESCREVIVNLSDSMLTNVSLLEEQVHGGTDFDQAISSLKKPYERVVVLSDMQNWMSEGPGNDAFKKYKEVYGVSPKLFSFDVTGYGTSQFPEKDVFCLAGISDKSFELMQYLDEGLGSMVDKIRQIII